MLVRICDFFGVLGVFIGRIFCFVFLYYIVMENIMYGWEEVENRGDVKWENWDLKLMLYFYFE